MGSPKKTDAYVKINLQLLVDCRKVNEKQRKTIRFPRKMIILAKFLNLNLTSRFHQIEMVKEDIQ